MLELVLKDWVTDTNETPWTSNSSMSLAKRTGQSVDLVNQHNVNRARPDIGQELLQRRAVERGTGECTIVVAAGDQPPAFVRLALYICLAGLALSVERVEGKLEIVLGRFARIDGTARELADGSVHATDIPWLSASGSIAARWAMALTPVCAPGLPRLPCALRRLWCPRRRCGAMPP